jgi:anti-anti-sigma regulatory factor
VNRRGEARGHRPEPGSDDDTSLEERSGDGTGNCAENGWTFSEVVDGQLGSVRARGRLDRQAADMLGGTVEALRRGGHARIVLDLAGAYAVDDTGLHLIRSLQDRISATGGRLTVLDAPAPARG